jgi:hypothetical protein
MNQGIRDVDRFGGVSTALCTLCRLFAQLIEMVEVGWEQSN